jgi:hypothetical protein
MTGRFSKDRFRSSTITLEEKDGKAVTRILAGATGDPPRRSARRGAT